MAQATEVADLPTDRANERLTLIFDSEEAEVPITGKRYRETTYYLTDGELVVQQYSEAYNYVEEEMVCTGDFTFRFELADDGVTVDHDGRTWRNYAGERFVDLLNCRFPHAEIGPEHVQYEGDQK